MKKNYKAPCVEIMNLVNESLLTTVSSEGIGWGGNGGGKTPESRRRHNAWEDDEEDDF